MPPPEPNDEEHKVDGDGARSRPPPTGASPRSGHARPTVQWSRTCRRSDNSSRDVRAARDFVADRMRRCGADTADVDAVRLAVSELAANAAAHAPLDWTVCLRVSRRWYTVSVWGGVALPDSLVFHPERWGMVSPGAAAGRGLGIVRLLMTEVWVMGSRGGVTIGCRLRR
jgi:anti-sigma regulatory factor (Ser/Thr protein kinase)